MKCCCSLLCGPFAKTGNKSESDTLIGASSKAKAFSERELLFPPEVVTQECKDTLLNYVSAMLDYSSPIVFVCYGVDSNVDATPAGPGLFFAAALIRALHDHNIRCICSYPEAIEQDTCLQFLIGACSCKLFLVIDTEDVYRCRTCLEQIYCAQSNQIDIKRLRFDVQSPGVDDWWCNIPSEDTHGIRKRTDAIQCLCTSPSIPEPPEIVQRIPDLLQTVAIDIEKKITSIEAYKAMPIHKKVSPDNIGASKVIMKAHNSFFAGPKSKTPPPRKRSGSGSENEHTKKQEKNMSPTSARGKKVGANGKDDGTSSQSQNVLEAQESLKSDLTIAKSKSGKPLAARRKDKQKTADKEEKIRSTDIPPNSPRSNAPVSPRSPTSWKKSSDKKSRHPKF